MRIEEREHVGLLVDLYSVAQSSKVRPSTTEFDSGTWEKFVNTLPKVVHGLILRALRFPPIKKHKKLSSNNSLIDELY